MAAFLEVIAPQNNGVLSLVPSLRYETIGDSTILYCSAPRGVTVSVLIDTADLGFLSAFGNWRVYNFKSRGGYSRPYVVCSVHGRTFYMHRVLTDCPKGELADHRNGRGTDNRRHNLRVVTHQVNMLNRHRFGISSKYARGVSFNKKPGLTKPFAGRVGDKHLGVFATAEEARQAVEAYLKLQLQ